MSVLSRIEWTDATWNPVRGCTFVNSMGDFFHEEIPPSYIFARGDNDALGVLAYISSAHEGLRAAAGGVLRTTAGLCERITYLVGRLSRRS
jgi:hypothetical protein